MNGLFGSGNANIGADDNNCLNTLKAVSHFSHHWNVTCSLVNRLNGSLISTKFLMNTR